MASNDTFLKKIEIRFRHGIIKVLGKFFRRAKPIPHKFDFSTAKYLFIRQDRIGDVLVSTPLFSLLKSKYPEATVDVFLSSNNYFVLENSPHIRKRWVYTKKLFETIHLLRCIRKERYDFAIDLMDNPSATSTLLCLLVGARWTIGLDKENSYVYDVRVPLRSRKDTHIVERLAELLTVFGITPHPEKLKIEYIPKDESRSFADRFYKEIASSSGVIGINISAGGSVRFWGVENFRSLISFLHEKYKNYSIVLLYSPSHKAFAEQIASTQPVLQLAPQTDTFDQFAALIERLTVLITPDTSAVHLAAAFGIPSVVLYVQSNKELRIWDPYRTPCVPVITDVDNLQTISVQKVESAFNELMLQLQS